MRVSLCQRLYTFLDRDIHDTLWLLILELWIIMISYIQVGLKSKPSWISYFNWWHRVSFVLVMWSFFWCYLIHYSLCMFVLQCILHFRPVTRELVQFVVASNQCYWYYCIKIASYFACKITFVELMCFVSCASFVENVTCLDTCHGSN